MYYYMTYMSNESGLLEIHKFKTTFMVGNEVWFIRTCILQNYRQSRYTLPRPFSNFVTA